MDSKALAEATDSEGSFIDSSTCCRTAAVFFFVKEGKDVRKRADAIYICSMFLTDASRILVHPFAEFPEQRKSRVPHRWMGCRWNLKQRLHHTRYNIILITKQTKEQ